MTARAAGPPARKPTFETSASMRVGSAQAALARLRDPSTWSSWQSEIGRAEGPAPLEAGDHVLGDASMLGFAVAGRADVVSAGERVVEHDVIVGVRMKVRYTLEPADDGWLLTHRLTAELPRGLSGRVLSVFLKRRLRHMQQRLIRDLAAAIARGGEPSEQTKPAERSEPVI